MKQPTNQTKPNSNYPLHPFSFSRKTKIYIKQDDNIISNISLFLIPSLSLSLPISLEHSTKYILQKKKTTFIIVSVFCIPKQKRRRRRPNDAHQTTISLRYHLLSLRYYLFIIIICCVINNIINPANSVNFSPINNKAMNTSTYACETAPFSNDWFNAKHIGQQPEQLSIEQLLSLMNQINASVKGGLFNAQLANQIFVLCQQLKFSGQLLEQSHKNELNRVFVSLRQACCRDNGQLGTPCRLKMMELVELRAMGWRPSLAHTQYYLNRPEQQQQQQIDPAPVSAPPFGAIPVNPFGNFAAPPPPLYVGADVNSPVIAPQPTPASFYLIPAAAASGWARPMIAPGVVPSGNILPQLTPIDVEAWAKANKQLQQTKLKAKTPQNRVPQLREEMVIRNSDSGKIMGVKGRRVAVVEELSKTVISFQKVDSKCKDRTLTITGSTQESIDYAKRLIEQTIRRNVSPNRVTAETNGADVDDNDDDDVGISIETTQDGTLKLSCADPQVLQAAQAALSEYLTRVGRNHSRLSAEERELRKERRKSMPLQSSSNRQNANYDISSGNDCNAQWRSSGKTGSTPNLAQLNNVSAGSDGNAAATNANMNVKRYERGQLLELRSAVGRLDSKTTKTIHELEIERTQYANE